jgi:hypothetical protein
MVVVVVVVVLESPLLPGQAVNKADTARAVKIFAYVFIYRPVREVGDPIAGYNLLVPERGIEPPTFSLRMLKLFIKSQQNQRYFEKVV